MVLKPRGPAWQTPQVRGQLSSKKAVRRRWRSQRPSSSHRVTHCCIVSWQGPAKPSLFISLKGMASVAQRRHPVPVQPAGQPRQRLMARSGSGLPVARSTGVRMAEHTPVPPGPEQPPKVHPSARPGSVCQSSVHKGIK